MTSAKACLRRAGLNLIVVTLFLVQIQARPLHLVVRTHLKKYKRDDDDDVVDEDDDDDDDGGDGDDDKDKDSSILAFADKFTKFGMVLIGILAASALIGLVLILRHKKQKKAKVAAAETSSSQEKEEGRV
jgi:hypothetical protein